MRSTSIPESGFMSIAGTWTITQSWPDGEGFGPKETTYPFKAKFRDDGAVNAVLFLFFGAWTESDVGGDVHFALTGFQTLTLYQGTLNGDQLSGTMRGLAHIMEHVRDGTWSAVRVLDEGSS
jgi:hypothetical protein